MAERVVAGTSPAINAAFLAVEEDDDDDSLDLVEDNVFLACIADEMRVHEEHDASFTSMLGTLDDLSFFQHLRLSKAAFNYLHQLLEHEEVPDQTYARGKQKIPLRERLHITLWYLANKTTFRDISIHFNISISSASRVFYETLLKICAISSNIIKWPSDLHQTQTEFQNIAGFPGVIGAIDGTHIKICPPANHNEYLDRTMSHSITLLAVCDANKKFTYIATGFPGSIHDQRCLSLSALGGDVRSFPNSFFPGQDVHLIGDSAFTLQTGMMVPFKDHGRLSESQKYYNHALSQTRVIIENAFGFLKNRFRCLLKLEVDLEHMSNIVVGCCTLHNLALMFPDGFLVPSEPDVAPVVPAEDDEAYLANPNAAAKRQAICYTLAGNLQQ